MTNPVLNFPYRLKFTHAEKEELLARIEHYRFTLRDAVGLSGHVISLDEGTIANLAGHLALVELGHIWGRVRTDEGRMFADQVEWLVTKDHPAEPQESDDVQRDAQLIKQQIDRELSPAARAELARIFLNEAKDVDR